MSGVKKSKILLKLINSALLIILVILFTKISLFERIFFQNTSLYDFDTYYSLVKNIRDGINPYLRDTFSLGPPLVFLYFFPFSFVELPEVRLLTTLINIISGFILCFLLAKKFNRKYLLTTFLSLAILFFSSFLSRFSLGMGQPTALITLFITLVIVSKNDFSKGLFLSATACLKTFFIFPSLSFLKNKKTAFLTFLLSTVSLTLLSLLFIKPEWYIYYFNKIFLNLNNTPLASSRLDYYNQSLKSTFFRLGAFDVYKIIFIPILAATSILSIVGGSFEFSLVATILLSPISWQHYFLTLFPVFVAVFFKMKKDLKHLAIFSLAFLLWFLEFSWLHDASQNFPNTILASHYFISGLLLLPLVWPGKKKN